MSRALLALTGSDHWTLADGTLQPSGYWPEELATVYDVFDEAGLSLTIATPAGVIPTADEMGFLPIYNGDSEAQAGRLRSRVTTIVDNNAPAVLENCNQADYDLIFIPGGWGPMEDLAVSRAFGSLLCRFAAADKPIAAVCHGPAALLPARSDDGSWLFTGRDVTGFSNKEESEVGFTSVAKWTLEDRLRAEGGRYSASPDDWAPHIAVDGNLYTGQNPASTETLARRVVADLTA
ncbi:type 1 glutamine amidotransferase domain-containing protein [Rudaeicoccus suwonensis]|uniref:Putative intracellular protease/amidase n=1 Tax=Rudaeicoccus suwonensis TaxID=657409 RepID=A0A561E310_9MICO|nr:type 1 glutamine amidotransferase domain-containing protein [Rudaeicoccus suwonensis]TWE09989.1 putative intracellular protease/amidase [Rudaeicoccus suwonensis]